MNKIDQRAAGLGITKMQLPDRLFQPYVLLNGLILTSGHTGDVRGALGLDCGLEDGERSAEQAITKLISAVLTVRGSLDGLRFASLRVYVRSHPDFIAQPQVADAASNVVHEVFGLELGAHSRSAIGVAALPHGVAVEVEGVLQEVAHG